MNIFLPLLTPVLLKASTPNVLKFRTHKNIHHHIMPQYLGAARWQPTKTNICPLETFDVTKITIEYNYSIKISRCDSYVTSTTLFFPSMVDVTVRIVQKNNILVIGWSEIYGFEVIFMCHWCERDGECRWATRAGGRRVSKSTLDGGRSWPARCLVSVGFGDRTVALRCWI